MLLTLRSNRLFPRTYVMKCTSRSQDDQNLIKTELSNAANMAAYANVNLGGDGPAKTYREAFIPKVLLDANIVDQLKTEYGLGADMEADSPAKPYSFDLTCDNDSTFCKNGYYAHMSDAKSTMNLCNKWFDDLKTTSDLLANCKGDSPQYKNLQDIWPGKAQALLHEWTHTKYYKDGSDKTLDYAYGVQGCLNLAAGSHKPAKRPNGKAPCPDSNGDPDICDPNLAPDNADTLAIMAGGMWFSDMAQCNREIPIDLTPAQPPTVDNADGYVIDDSDDDDAPTPTPAPTPSPSPPAPAPSYATGTCSFHLTETQDCDSNYGNNLYGVVTMYDNDKNVIGQTVKDDGHPIGYAMDDGNSYSFTSKLKDPLVITGEHENDYVQFTIGGLSWQSKSPNGGASCSVGGWDPRDGPVCGLRWGNQNAVSPQCAV